MTVSSARGWFNHLTSEMFPSLNVSGICRIRDLRIVLMNVLMSQTVLNNWWGFETWLLFSGKVQYVYTDGRLIYYPNMGMFRSKTRPPPYCMSRGREGSVYLLDTKRCELAIFENYYLNVSLYWNSFDHLVSILYVKMSNITINWKLTNWYKWNIYFPANSPCRRKKRECSSLSLANSQN